MRSTLILMMFLALFCWVGHGWSPAQPEPSSGPTGIVQGLPSLHSPKLDTLADRRERPLWAPLGVLEGHNEMVAPLVKMLQDGEPTERARAAFVLGQIAAPPAAEPLYVAAYRDNDRNVRLHAGIALAYCGDERGLPPARAALVSEQPWVRFYAIMGLWRLGKPRAWAALNRSQAAQPQFLGNIICEALQTPPKLRGATEVAPTNASGPTTVSSTHLWEAVAGAYGAETDWWWHYGDYDQAIRCLQTVIFFQPHSIDTYGDIAWLQWSLGYNTEAIGTYHRGIRANPDNPEGYYNLGYHYFNLDKYSPALPYLKQAVDRGGRRIMRRTYAHALERLGQIAASFEQWEYMIQESPDDPAVQLNYNQLRELAGQESAD